MGSRESSLRGHQTTPEPVPVSGSSFCTTFPVQTRSGSMSPVTDFPFHPKGSSMIGTNGSNFVYYNNQNAKKKPSGVIAFHSSAQWKAHFDAAKDSDKLMAVHFTATWCGPCRSMDAVINDYAEKYTNVEFIKIDVDELHDVSMKYQIVSMPTFLLMKKGNIVDKVVGADKEQLKAKIEHRLY